MIDTDEYIQMWKDNLLSTEGVAALTNRLIGDNMLLRHDVWYVLNAIDLSDYGEYPHTREKLEHLMFKYDIEYMGEEE